MDLRRLTLAACVLALAAPLGLAACGDEEPGVDEPAREGLALELDGITYNVFITRQLNPRVPPDERLRDRRGAGGGDPLRRVHPGLQPLRRGARDGRATSW